MEYALYLHEKLRLPIDCIDSSFNLLAVPIPPQSLADSDKMRLNILSIQDSHARPQCPIEEGYHGCPSPLRVWKAGVRYKLMS